jgi:hypothetical protein
MGENLNTNENSNYENRVISPVIVEALKKDEHLNALYTKLNELYSKAIPKVIQVSEREFKASYSDEFDELVAKIQQEIDFRCEQIVSYYNR